MKVRVTIPVTFHVSYILDVPEPTPEEVERAILSDDFDPSDWEFDPCFYENLWDAIKVSLAAGVGVGIEPLER